MNRLVITGMVSMTEDQYIAIAGVVGTFLGVSATLVVAKIAQSKKGLSYRLRMETLLPKKLSDPHDNLVIQYKGEELPEPVLLTVDITNTGNVPIENPPIQVVAKGATYVVPGYFENPPPGYADLWSITRTDAEACAIGLAHINPGQTARARLLMDELPDELPEFECPMVGLKVKKQTTVATNAIVLALLDVFFPSLSAAIRIMDTTR